MPPELTYAEAKFCEAVEALATSDAAMRDRLMMASMAIIAVQESNFPEGEILEAYRELKRALTKIKDNEQGHIPATLAKMRRPQTGQVALMFTNLLSMIQSELRRHRGHSRG